VGGWQGNRVKEYVTNGCSAESMPVPDSLDDHAPANFTTIKHIAHNLLRTAPSTASLRLRRKLAAWDDDFLTGLIAR
jgi:hypothetical protein